MSRKYVEGSCSACSIAHELIWALKLADQSKPSWWSKFTSAKHTVTTRNKKWFTVCCVVVFARKVLVWMWNTQNLNFVTFIMCHLSIRLNSLWVVNFKTRGYRNEMCWPGDLLYLCTKNKNQKAILETLVFPSRDNQELLFEKTHLYEWVHRNKWPNCCSSDIWPTVCLWILHPYAKTFCNDLDCVINTLSNGILHMQINVFIFQTQLFET